MENDPNDQVLIDSALRATGTRSSVRMLGDAAEAISYLKGEGVYADRAKYPYPSFLITDLKLPGLDGLALLEYLRSTPRAAIIPTIVFSSSSDPDDIDKAYTLGASSYHVKPMSADQLMKQFQLIYDYWMSCEVPEVDRCGLWKTTDSSGRIGERYSANPFPPHKPT